MLSLISSILYQMWQHGFHFVRFLLQAYNGLHIYSLIKLFCTAVKSFSFSLPLAPHVSSLLIYNWTLSISASRIYFINHQLYILLPESSFIKYSNIDQEQQIKPLQLNDSSYRVRIATAGKSQWRLVTHGQFSHDNT